VKEELINDVDEHQRCILEHTNIKLAEVQAEVNKRM